MHGFAVAFPLDLKYDELEACATCHGPESYEENARAATRAAEALVLRENRDAESSLYGRFDADRIALVGWSTGAATVVKLAHLCDTIRQAREDANATAAGGDDSNLRACGATDRLRAVVSLAPTIGANASDGGTGLSEHFYDLSNFTTPLMIVTGAADEMGAADSARLFVEQAEAAQSPAPAGIGVPGSSENPAAMRFA